MYIIEKTDIFDKWLLKLEDIRAKAKILTRLKIIELGNLGDHKSVGAGVSEFRINYGPGYRLYYGKRGTSIILLLAGGDKSSQAKDILKAQKILQELENKHGV
ncbi:MAG TPA: type II toxin-antitoxin system RelE/ParE family toxin [bacterium]|nr:type II toxin-antitoxin system RelE/ParE family toxin [bacterium]HPN42000.1 type II toxin-antitoxin system RelE/ParE family toxin [bacterium]